MYKIVFEHATVARRATYTLTSSFPATLFSFFFLFSSLSYQGEGVVSEY